MLLVLLFFVGAAEAACPFKETATSPCPMGLQTDSPAPPLLPSGERTSMGCECNSKCGGTITKAYARCDWCYTKDKCGQKGRSGTWDYCVYPGMKVFDAQYHGEKTTQLWSEVTNASVVGKSAHAKGWAAVLKQAVTESMITPFDDYMEVMPVGRSKVIHTQGVHCLFNLEVTSDKFTGILQAGNQTGIVRMGSATSLDSTTPFKTPIMPGLGIKFPRSRVRSASFVALRDSGPGGPWDFFDSVFTNHAKPAAALMALNKFQQASGCISMVGLSDVCTYTQEGKKVSSPVFPFELMFEPSAIHLPNQKKSNAALLKELSSIPVGSEIFKVNAYASPADMLKGNKIPVGRMTTTGTCYQSLFGDEHLFFRHQRMEEDFALRPKWIQQMSALKDSVCKATAGPISKWQCVPVPPPATD